jgi:ABC-type Na+ transport system ATPase subunit NatA
MNTTTRERVRRYIVIHQGSGRIVATSGGTHRMMERICDKLDFLHPGTYIYDDATAASEYLPQVGPNLSVSR